MRSHRRAIEYQTVCKFCVVGIMYRFDHLLLPVNVVDCLPWGFTKVRVMIKVKLSDILRLCTSRCSVVFFFVFLHCHPRAKLVAVHSALGRLSVMSAAIRKHVTCIFLCEVFFVFDVCFGEAAVDRS